MRSSRFFTSTIHFFSGIFFVFCGLLTLMISWTPSYRTVMVTMLTEGWLPLTITGIVFIGLGIALLQLITVRRRSYYQLRSGEQAVAISESLIEESRLNSAISRLRRKIEPDPANPKYILTHRSRGYKLAL